MPSFTEALFITQIYLDFSFSTNTVSNNFCAKVHKLSYLFFAIMPNKTHCVLCKAVHLLCRSFTGHFLFLFLTEVDFHSQRCSNNFSKASDFYKISVIRVPSVQTNVVPRLLSTRKTKPRHSTPALYPASTATP